tara:strand:+ start:377 stop:631 length:255 start_codon:yes stop_codon:yes gene_type:complete
MTKSVHLHYCQVEEDHFPMAITRFTSYDIDNKPLCVEQVTYESNIDYLERQVINALSCDVEVSILTTLPINNFKRLYRIFQKSK